MSPGASVQLTLNCRIKMVRNRTPVAQEWEGNTPRANKSGIVAQNTGFV
ncbi:MAG: hypothetical protein RMY64_31765 [Nostoc sp. DedQUE08]|nr:hypothetical protein [Nostoc sp. DedQUE08]